ncbi:SDR family oxidoreductase [Rhizobium sullae]|uniref:SDR family oxidoreductase n=1 Tax=Rhizobium sullae TaxID=50338 RepID=UPI000B3527D3|nr:SDR family oxidoreductase [Rhizobium sullae]
MCGLDEACLTGERLRLDRPPATAIRNFLPLTALPPFLARQQSSSRPPSIGRIGSAGKAVAVALFLLCDDSSYVTGSQYAVDGGLTLP